MAAIVVLAAVGATVRWWPRSAPPAGNSFEPVPLTSLPGSESSPTFNPDATQVAFAWSPGGGRGTDVYVQVVGAAGDPKPITSDGAIHTSPAWSPDGKSVALWHSQADSGRVSLMLASPVGGGIERTLLEWNGTARTYGRIAWSPDSKWIAVSSVRAGLMPASSDGLVLVSVPNADQISWAGIHAALARSTSPAFSPDGQTLVYVRYTGNHTGEVYVVPFGSDGRPGGVPKLVHTPFKEALEVRCGRQTRMSSSLS